MAETNELDPAHIGTVGEALFCAAYAPPSPIPHILLDHIEEISPEWVTPEEGSLRVFNSQDNHYFSIEDANGETTRWEKDAEISYSYFARDGDTVPEDHQLGGQWMLEFPVEIKTGPRAKVEANQRTVMEYLAANTDYQPIIVRLGLDGMPDEFVVEEVELVQSD
ncbi:hypothetical protein [Halobaculum limi]|uniref:hypothetical protein n=1 Tax=Halobaculum limi TaxID=3031916 RepID=UPI0024074D98|nr:hypothetical protein [Halobaculum sp. YSMS11]